jgi:hypothetical protein
LGNSGLASFRAVKICSLPLIVSFMMNSFKYLKNFAYLTYFKHV